MQHPNPAGVYSITSPVQAAVDIVLSLIFGAKYNLDYYMNGNAPEGIISLPGATQLHTDAFKQKLNATIMTGRDQFGLQRRVGHRLPVVGNDNVKFTPLTFPSKDMEILDQQQWFTKILWMQFGVTPSEMGFTEDASKNVDENQSKIARRRGVKPILDNIAFHLNTQIIPELDPKNMFEFKWDEVDIDEDIKKRTLQEQEIRMGLKSWQLIAEEEGLDINRLEKDKQANMEQMQEFSVSEGDGTDNPKEEPKKEETKKDVEEKSIDPILIPINPCEDYRGVDIKSPLASINVTNTKSTTTDSGGEGVTDTPLVPVENDKKKKKKKKVLDTDDKGCPPETKAKDISLDQIVDEVAKEIEEVGKELVKKVKEE